MDKLMLFALLRLLNAQVYDLPDLTDEMLINREQGQVIVEITEGYVINDQKDGRITNPFAPDHTYISYSEVPNAEVGDYITTYCVYNPYSNYEDDIIARFDFIN